MQSLVSEQWLNQRLSDPRLVIFDASVGDFRHWPISISQARPFDLDGDMSDHHSPLPHTLPSVADLGNRLRDLGLNNDSIAVCYDVQGIFSSARAWWMLKSLGLENVAVLDGGLPGWEAAGYPIQSQPASYSGPVGNFQPQPLESAYVDSDQVRQRLATDAPVIDVRSQGRFAGTEPEPRPGLRSGHMPGAINLPFTDLQDSGHMRPTSELHDQLTSLTGNADSVTFSCGSGVTACIGALAADLAGQKNIRVYDGSWSEWGREDQDFPVETA